MPWFGETRRGKVAGGEKGKKRMDHAVERPEDLGFELENGVPKSLLAMPKEKLHGLLGDLGRNWLTGDGIWFQAVEARDGIWDAKRCNDSCWTRFSPFEAWSIRRFLGLPEAAGLAGLKRA